MLATNLFALDAFEILQNKSHGQFIELLKKDQFDVSRVVLSQTMQTTPVLTANVQYTPVFRYKKEPPRRRQQRYVGV